MKNARFERLGRMQRQYHRNHPWRLSPGGLYIPHAYEQTHPARLSSWDDVGFILNKRRVMVWWRHPRCVYADALEEQSWREAGDDPREAWLMEGSTKNYRKVGASRKRIVSYATRPPSAERLRYYDRFRSIRERLTSAGIDLQVSASWTRERLAWATGLNLVAPMEVRNEAELALVALLARRLMLGRTTLEAEFPGYRYSRVDWLREQGERI